MKPKSFFILLLLLLDIGIAHADDTPKNGIFVWTSGSATCYQLTSMPTVTYTTNDNITSAALTISEEQQLTLPLTNGATLEMVYGTYVETSLTLNSSGLTTFSFSLPIQITSGATAYKASFNSDKTQLNCSAITDNKIPAYTGVILKGAASGTVNYAIISSADAVSDNALQPTTTASGLATKSGNVLVLKGDQFVKYSGSTFTANKAYIQDDTNIKNFSLSFDADNTTSISTTESFAPVQKVGKYIFGGRLVIVKDGIQYNADGTIIK